MSQPTLLLIAANSQFSYLLHRYSEQAGCEMVDVTSIEQAQEWLFDHQPAMVLLHVSSWPHAGWSLVAPIKGHCSEHGIPITVISSVIDEARARAEGATHWLWQPVMYVDFLTTLQANNIEATFPPDPPTSIVP